MEKMPIITVSLVHLKREKVEPEFVVQVAKDYLTENAVHWIKYLQVVFVALQVMSQVVSVVDLEENPQRHVSSVLSLKEIRMVNAVRLCILWMLEQECAVQMVSALLEMAVV